MTRPDDGAPRTPETERALQYERAVNGDYLAAQEKIAKTRVGMLIKTFGPGGRLWAGDLIHYPTDKVQVGPFVKRVAVKSDDPLVPHDFYLGPRHAEWGDKIVLSWVSAFGRLFYSDVEFGTITLQTRTGTSFEVTVEAVRTFLTRDRDLSDLTEAPSPTTRFPDEPAPTVPVAPRPVERPVSITESVVGGDWRAHPERAPQPGPVDDDLLGTVRNPELVEKAISRPKTGVLHPLLGTLQPGQHRLVTWPPDEPLIVQGQPGTGKTVVATHRAAWLAHPDRPDGPESAGTSGGSPAPPYRVALIGPTDLYARHVAEVAERAGADRIDILSWNHVLDLLSGMDEKLRDDPETADDSDRAIWRFLQQARRRLERLGRFDAVPARPTRQRDILLTAMFDRDRALAPTLEAHPTVERWIRSIGSYKTAESLARLQPVFAAAGRISGASNLGREHFDHIVIDEAQDLRPLEWMIVMDLLGHDASLGAVSIFGDLNQRHIDFAVTSWGDLAEQLQLTEVGVPAQVESLEVGYRSTREILRFANQLLPRGERSAQPILIGRQPEVVRVAAGEVASRAITLAVEQIAQFPEGSVAVISADPRPIRDGLRSAGWRPFGDLEHWISAGRPLRVLDHTSARGVEFDAVVLVEPVDFPERIGRFGTLYTSMTRATHHLVVVHSKGLPKAVKAPKEH